MQNDIYSFYELIETYNVEIPIIQRDYAQGREENTAVCENFLMALKEKIVNNTQINLDFIYGNVKNGEFLPLDGQQRLTTLFLLHWYTFVKEKKGHDVQDTLKKFSYETRISSRRFCRALVDYGDFISPSNLSISSQIQDSKWFYISWKHDPTIRAMLKAIDLIDKIFRDVAELWEALVQRKNVVFHLLILENFGLSDDLYIKMNARGRLLTPFENLKAEIQDKSIKEGWEANLNEQDKFSYKIDTAWTRFLWHDFRKNDSVDPAHMNFITTLVMAKLPGFLKGAERYEIIQKLNKDSSARELIQYIDQDVFCYICKAYRVYERHCSSGTLPSLDIEMWTHTPEEGSLLYEILLGSNTSYSHKVLFFAQTEYLLRNPAIDQKQYTEWMRVVRNIVSRANVDKNGKRSDIVRSPEDFNSAITLVKELAEGCSNIYKHLYCTPINSKFVGEQIREEKLKAEIINNTPEYKNLIFKTEDNDLLRGKIMFALVCANYNREISEIDFNLLEKVQVVFETYFNRDLSRSPVEFDKLRRAMLTISKNGVYRYYEYWWSYWNAGDAEKRKLFPTFREIEYFIGLAEYTSYFKELVLLLISKKYDEIISDFVKPDAMENWQYRLIKEDALLSNCSSKYFAISKDRSYCYLLKGKRPSDIDGSQKIE
ncbi:MAG: DUF262 domain-containing protein [Oscillospiraceae bacterium]|nr:DUF262 domain-containing protein [Oscillospiraceae bacterium]